VNRRGDFRKSPARIPSFFQSPTSAVLLMR
jgi:hypothetical protein